MKEINSYQFCLHCGEANAPDAKFCQNCGGALGGINAAAQATPASPEELTRLGASLLRFHRFSRRIEESLPKSRRRARELLEGGINHYNAKEYVAAVENFKKSAAMGEPEAYFALGVIYDSVTPEYTTDLAKALKYYLRAKRRGVMSSELFYNLAVIYRKNLNLTQATRYYEMSRACAEHDFAQFEVLQAQIKLINKAEKRLRLVYWILPEALLAILIFLFTRM